jgi:hypothetical protein
MTKYGLVDEPDEPDETENYEVKMQTMNMETI